jgi:hypothetical protein
MNIQTTNTPPAQRTIRLTTGGPAGIHLGGFFQHDGRIWRAMQVSDAEITGEWVPNQEVTRTELPGIGPLTW